MKGDTPMKKPPFSIERHAQRGLSVQMARAKWRASGQAMVEFVVALFAVVLVVAGIADFIVAASRRSEIFSTLRGKAGGAAMAASAGDAALVSAGAEPRAVTSEDALAAHFVHEADSEDVPLSRALGEWLFLGGRDTLTAGDEVWMPPLEVEGAAL